MITDGQDYKIGVAKDPFVRLKSLQTGNKNQLSIIFTEQKNNAYKVEKYLHARFSKHRMSGEWFTGITLRDIRVELLLCTEHD